MNHRFSNTKRVRDSIAPKRGPLSWSQVPLELRIMILDELEPIVKQVVDEASPEHAANGLRYVNAGNYIGYVFVCKCGERFMDKSELFEHVEDSY